MRWRIPATVNRDTGKRWSAMNSECEKGAGHKPLASCGATLEGQRLRGNGLVSCGWRERLREPLVTAYCVVG
jgi:hypothetical protein